MIHNSPVSCKKYSPEPVASALPPDGPVYPSRAGTMGMWIFLTSLAILFAASMVGYLVVRSRFEQWPPEGMPPLPAGLWASTIVIMLSSLSIQIAYHCVRADKQGGLIATMLITTLLGVVFLFTQGLNWAWLIAINEKVNSGLYMSTFYLLTALHALHVIGGLIYLGYVTARSFTGTYHSAFHPGVKYAVMYWHFLGVVWLVMFVMIFLI